MILAQQARSALEAISWERRRITQFLTASPNRTHRLVRRLSIRRNPSSSRSKVTHSVLLSCSRSLPISLLPPTTQISALPCRGRPVPDMGLFCTLRQRVSVSRAARMITLAEVVQPTRPTSSGLSIGSSRRGRHLRRRSRSRASMRYCALPMALTKAVYAKGCTTLDEALLAEADYQPILGGFMWARRKPSRKTQTRLPWQWKSSSGLDRQPCRTKVIDLLLAHPPIQHLC